MIQRNDHPSDLRCRPFFLLSLAALLALVASGCGDQEFRTVSTQLALGGPGNYQIPPKIDILLAEDDTGSMFEIYDAVSAQLPRFLNGLDGKNWDYRFATTPLTQSRALDQIIASKHDPNWGSQWKPPFPGADAGSVDRVDPAYFRTPDQYSHFIDRGTINNNLNGLEPGLQNIERALTAHAPATGFLRRDAMLVVIALGNGQDTSGLSFCTRSDGVVVLCNGQTWETGLDGYKSRLLALKNGLPMVKFYAAVANSSRSNCLGGRSYVGTRYQWMENVLSGRLGFDICTQPLESVLGAIASHLQSQKLLMRTRYLFIDQEPNPSTIQVVKHSGGSRFELPQSPVNGWTYAGYVDAYAIDHPFPMSKMRGYAIELHGPAKLVGEETAEVTFKPAGFAN